MPNDALPKKETYVFPPEAQQAVSRKAEELYEKRVALYAPDLAPRIKEAIIGSQKLVYLIDYYGEHHKQIDPAILDSLWKNVEKFFSDLGIEKSLQVTLLQDVKDYADIEISTRMGKKLSDYELRYFYFKKSCDVRRLRHMVRYFTKQPVLSSDTEVTEDILGQIEDDIDDIEEDKLTPLNGNRLLEILNSKGVEKLDEYIIFLDSLKDVSPELVKKIKLAITRLKSFK